MKGFSCVLILILFASVYIFCVCAFTFITGLNNLNYIDDNSNKNVERNFNNPLARLRRETVDEKSTPETNISFNVCCDKGEYLNAKLECITRGNGTRESDEVSFLPETAVVDKDFGQGTINLERIVLQYNFNHSCPKDEIVVITWNQGQTVSYYISKSNGYLLQLSDDRKTIVSNYSTSSFCLNSMEGPEKFTVALLCPCKEKVCIQKCCPIGFYYNTVTSTCKKESEDGITSFKPKFNDDASFHLMYNVPNCTGPDRMIIDQKNKSLPLSVLKNGHLMKSYDEAIFRKEYCVDTFSNGNDNSSYVNGFYCPHAAKFIPVGDVVVPQKIEEEDYSLPAHALSTCCSACIGLLITGLIPLFLTL